MTSVLHYAAFTTVPTGGNPAGVVLDADGLPDARMQEIAAEVGYSETAFVLAEGRPAGRYGLRFFSPLAEVAFCGHATVATAVALAGRSPGTLVFETPAGDIEVSTSTDGGVVRASLRSVPGHSRPVGDRALTEALAALRWRPEDLHPAYPPHVAFAGNDHLVLATRTRERLAELDYDFAALKQLSDREGWTTLQLFWPEAEGVVHARNPFPSGGVVEDPATGAAAAALGAYLRAIGRVPEDGRLTIHQGADMGRPSELIVTVDPDDPRITVTGTAVPLDAPATG